MDYGQALARARRGKAIMRPHFHWCAIVWRKNAFYMQHNDGSTEPWVSDADDRKAKDWCDGSEMLA